MLVALRLRFYALISVLMQHTSPQPTAFISFVFCLACACIQVKTCLKNHTNFTLIELKSPFLHNQTDYFQTSMGFKRDGVNGIQIRKRFRLYFWPTPARVNKQSLRPTGLKVIQME